MMERGLDPQSVRLVVFDEHQGLKSALRCCYPIAKTAESQGDSAKQYPTWDIVGIDIRPTNSAHSPPNLPIAS